MVTHIWLKSQPKKKLSYPDCYPYCNYNAGENTGISIISINTRINEAEYLNGTVSRIEFRP